MSDELGAVRLTNHCGLVVYVSAPHVVLIEEHKPDRFYDGSARIYFAGGFSIIVKEDFEDVKRRIHGALPHG